MTSGPYFAVFVQQVCSAASDAQLVDEEFALVDAIGNRFRCTPIVIALFASTALRVTSFTSQDFLKLRSLVKDLEELPDVSQVRSIFDVRRQGVAGAILPVIPKSAGQLDHPNTH